MNSIPSRKMGTYHTLYPPAAAIALARAALAPSSARVASPSSSTMCADARYLQSRGAAGGVGAWEGRREGRARAAAARRAAPARAPSDKCLDCRHCARAVPGAASDSSSLFVIRKGGWPARAPRAGAGGWAAARAGRSCAPFPPLGGERRPRRRLVRELADREEEEDGGLQPRERLGGVRLGLHLVELELARCAAVVAQVARAAHLVQVSAQEGAQVGLRQLAARAEQLVQVVPAVVRA